MRFYIPFLMIFSLSSVSLVNADINTEITACNKGDMDACDVVADRYDEEDGVKVDYKKAAYYYRKACNLQSGYGCRILGWYHDEGKGVKQDYLQSFNLYKKACNLNDGWGCNNLGHIYLDPTTKTIKKNIPLGLKLLKRSCDQQEIGMACRSVGYAYRNAEGVKENFHIANKYYARGCNTLEDASSCYNFAISYKNGDGVKEDKSIAKRYYLKACKLGDEDGCSEAKKM